AWYRRRNSAAVMLPDVPTIAPSLPAPPFCAHRQRPVPMAEMGPGLRREDKGRGVLAKAHSVCPNSRHASKSLFETARRSRDVRRTTRAAAADARDTAFLGRH